MGDGLGITIVYQALLRQLHSFLPPRYQAKKQSMLPVLPGGPEVGSTNCRFCQSVQREESHFLMRLVNRFQQVIDGKRDWSSLQTELCLPHMTQLLQTCVKEGAVTPSHWYMFRRYMLRQSSRNLSPEASRQREMQALAASLSHYTLQRVTELGHQAQATQLDWSQLAQSLALLVGDREALPVFIRTNTQRTVPRTKHVPYVAKKLLPASKSACTPLIRERPQHALPHALPHFPLIIRASKGTT